MFPGESGSLFTGIHFNTYFSPSGFCFDIVCSDQPIIDNPKSKDYNVDERVIIKIIISLVNKARWAPSGFRGNER